MDKTCPMKNDNICMFDYQDTCINKCKIIASNGDDCHVEFCTSFYFFLFVIRSFSF